jgi:hypothetical protein
MPRYVDVHHELLKGLTVEEVARLHQKDVAIQTKYGVRCLKYWFDPVTGKAFCLSDAPSKDAVLAMHREAHGIETDEIFEVQEGE